MGVVARQSIRGALANYIGIILGFFTTFFVLTDCLSQSEIGLTRVMVDAAMLFSGLAQLGTNASIVRFYPYFRDDKGDHGFFALSLILPFIGFLVFVVGFFLFKSTIVNTYAQSSPLFVDYLYLLIPLTFFALYLTVFETNASVLLRITIPKLVREVGIRLFNLIAYLLYGYGCISLDLFVILFCSSYALATLLNFAYLMSLGKVSFRIDKSFLSRRLLKDVVIYTLFMTATVLASNIPLINSLFLGAKQGLAMVGIYNIASYIANVIEVPYRSLGAISQPLISQAVKDNNIGEVNRLGQQVALHQMLIASLLFFFIWINIQALFALIPNGSDYVDGCGVVFFLGLAKIVNSSFNIGTSILNYSKHYMMALPLIAVLTLSAIVLNQYLIPLWTLNGSACATLFSYVLYFVLLMTFEYRRMGVRIVSKMQMRTILYILGLFVLSFVWDKLVHLSMANLTLQVLVGACIKTIVMGVVAVWAMYRLRLSVQINEMLEKVFSKLHKA